MGEMMVNFGLIFLVMFLLLLVVMDYQDKKNLKRSLKFTAWILGASAFVYILYLFMGMWAWSVVSIAIVILMGLSGRLFSQRKKTEPKK